MPWKIILGSGIKGKVLTTAISEWIKATRYLVKRRMYFLRKSMSTRSKSVFENKEIAAKLADIHDKYVVPADKASNNVFFVCKIIVYPMFH